MDKETILSKLCYYDPRNPNYDQENGDKKNPCFCDNCFYSRAPLAEYILELLNKLGI